MNAWQVVLGLGVLVVLVSALADVLRIGGPRGEVDPRVLSRDRGAWRAAVDPTVAGAGLRHARWAACLGRG
jgi:hypothetical protein